MTARLFVALVVLWGFVAAQAVAAENPGFVEFPRDEHMHGDGWDYWWGGADVVTESGNRYTLGLMYTSWNGVGFSGLQAFPRQGPYAGRSVLTVDGPPEWGHPEQRAGEAPPIVHRMSAYLPGVTDLLRVDAVDALAGAKVLDAWERTSLKEPAYRLRIDQDDARVHPGGAHVRFGVDLDVIMRDPPLLAGGTGQWWYGIPDTYDYPSRSFQYMQASQRVSGTLEVQQPDGTVLRERVVPGASRLMMIHEYDASPEDIPAGLAVAEATQLHPRYPQYYGLDWPWELSFLDLGNGAQLMLAALRFDDTEQGTLRPLTPEQPTHKVLATLRLPDGRSVPLDGDDVNVEHLSRRSFDPIGVASGGDGLRSLWTQTWAQRFSYPGGTIEGVEVPPFDLGLLPAWGKDEPLQDERGAALRQRVAYDVRGSFNGCPVEGFGWSELLVNWYGHEDEDPWFTGAEPPRVPDECEAPTAPRPAEPQKAAPPSGEGPPPGASDGCSVPNPPTANCEYDAKYAGGVGGHGAEPGGWTITITRPGLPKPIVMRSHGGNEAYPCGTVRRGDHVVVEAKPGSWGFAGNPGICT